MLPQVILIEGTSNLRDIGGYDARDGGRVKPGMILRGEALAFGNTPTKSAVFRPDLTAQYGALGCRTVVDLRGQREVAAAPNAWPQATGATLVELPMDAGGEGDATIIMQALMNGTLKTFGIAELTQFYAAMVRDLAPVLGRAFTVLAEPGRLPALVHCAAGKDRTGMFVALLLETLGTPREQVLADYEYTQVLRPNRVEAYRERLTAAGVDAEAVRTLFESPAPVMQNTLERIAAEHGSVQGYLTGPAQVDPAALDRLRAALIE